ncbi:MAG: hypothetical protein JO141_19545 [Bradyrhizobium sp.]|nr:hypothetical protein [Bradyrhizobium sp.]
MRTAGVQVWAWCLMPNHVHLVLVPWASTRAHVRGKDDGIITLAPVSDRFPHFAVCSPASPRRICSLLRAAESIGRPLGDDRFLSRIERRTGRVLKPGKRGPEPSAEQDDD